MSLFDAFHNDKVSVLKPDGTVVAAEIAAQVESKEIFIADSSIPIDIGYIITRALPNGILEEYVVEDPGYHEGFGGLPSGYEMRVRRKGTQSRSAPIHYHASGPNSRINIGSHDASVNIVQESDSAKLFASLYDALRQGVADEVQRQTLIAHAENMESAVGTPDFGERYRTFIESAAQYMTIVGPFIVPLASLVQSHLK